MRNFAAISIQLLNGEPRYIGTSTERFLCAENLETKDALTFLHSLHALARRRENKNAVFVWYDSQVYIELLLKELPKKAKDVLFPSPELNRKRKDLRALIASYDNVKRGKVIKERLSELRARLHKLEFVYWRGFRLRYREGKSLTIYRLDGQGKARKGLTIYDISHFFNRNALAETSWRYLGYVLQNIRLQPADIKEAYLHADAECSTVLSLACVLDSYLLRAGLTLTKWYGPSAAVNRLLAEWKVKREFKTITKSNTPPMLYNAIETAFIGGRIETTKLGMIPGIYTVDLNTAFAHAATLLPQLNHGWRYTREYDANEPFALWYTEYDLPESSYLGLLPHRRGNGGIVYRRAGRGWYYSPEVKELARRFPDCFTVRDGYIAPYNPVTFADKIKELYRFRCELAAREGKGKGEKIFKAILQRIYGKFAQTQGEAPYLCLPWAGWITSYVRAQILRAVAGQEQSVCYIHTDAIHTTEPLIAPRISEELGEWKSAYYPWGFYMAPGVCCFYDESGKIVKSATRGFEFIDFEKAKEELNELGCVTLSKDFFAGYQYSQAFACEADYLQIVNQKQVFRPRKPGGSRRFSLESFDWSKSYVDSRIVDFDDGRESARRTEGDLKRKLNLLLEARR